MEGCTESLVCQAPPSQAGRTALFLTYRAGGRVSHLADSQSEERTSERLHSQKLHHLEFL